MAVIRSVGEHGIESGEVFADDGYRSCLDDLARGQYGRQKNRKVSFLDYNVR